VDIGFAFLPAYWGKGYAYEAAAAVMAHREKVLGLNRIVAITSLDNVRSAKLLEKLGLRFEETLKLAPGSEEVKLFGTSV
jgi:RimJ/RimL family protein N-acetyltransferase